MTRLAPIARRRRRGCSSPSAGRPHAGGGRSQPRSSCCSTRRRSHERRGRTRRIDARAARVPARARARTSVAHGIGWRYRLVANGYSLSLPQLRAGTLSARCPACVTSSPPRRYAPQLDLHAAADRSAGAVGVDARHGGPGSEDRDHRLGDRPRPPVLRSDRIHDAPGLSEGAAALHHGEGDRRSRVRSESRRHGSRAHGSPSATTTRVTARTSPASQPGTPTPRRARGRVSGVAPRAYLGNYKVFVETDSGLSPNANSPAIVAAIEAAVADGMDVINFSGGEPEIEPSRDIVALALDAAAAAGVVPVVAAGNDYNDFGAGSVSSPGQLGRGDQRRRRRDQRRPTRTHAEFSSVGPTTISLRLKPDVAAPGRRRALLRLGRRLGRTLRDEHGGAARRGRCGAPAPASPGVDGGADQVCARPVRHRLRRESQSHGRPALPGRRRRRTVERADAPLRLRRAHRGFVRPARARSRSTRTVALDRRRRRSRDVAGHPNDSRPGGREALASGDGRRARRAHHGSDRVTSLSRARRPRRVRRVATRIGRETDSGVGARDGRRPREAQDAALCGKPGLYRSTTAGQAATVSRYRYPETPRGVGVNTTLRGPERVVHTPSRQAGRELRRRRHPARAREPRRAARRRRPRREPPDRATPGFRSTTTRTTSEFQEPVLAAGALSPARGDYAVVFDSAARGGAGSFAFRLLGERRDPTHAQAASPCRRSRRAAQVAATDAGAGVYADSIVALVDGSLVRASYRRGTISVLHRRPVGRHAPAPRTRVRLPGGEEHRERRAHPPEHADAHRQVQGPVDDPGVRPSLRSGRAATGFRDPRDHGSARADS